MAFQFRFAPHMTQIPSNPIFHLLPKLNEKGFISFAAGAPSPDSFPYKDIEKITSELLTGNSRMLLQYGSTEGYAPARASLAKMIRRYGLCPEDDQVLVTTGGQQAIDMMCRLFIEPGDVVLVESPTYSATLQILKSHRAQPIPLESDEDGFLPDDLERKIEIFEPKFIYLIPTFKNPSGETMSLERRRAAAEISLRTGTVVIEDDPYRDLRYSGEHLPPIKSFDVGDNVVFLTSTSKIFCPGLRVGAVYAPKPLIPLLTITKQVADMHSSILPQAIVSSYIEKGLLDDHIARLCENYRRKLHMMIDSIRQFFPKCVSFTVPKGGLFVWCVCPIGTDTDLLLSTAVEEKVAFVPGGSFFADGRGNNTIRLNCSNAPEIDIPVGIEKLGNLLHRYLN